MYIKEISFQSPNYPKVWLNKGVEPRDAAAMFTFFIYLIQNFCSTNYIQHIIEKDISNQLQNQHV